MLNVVGLVADGNGVNISASPSGDWNNASVPESERRINRKGSIYLILKKLSIDNASAGDTNSIVLESQTLYGGINLRSLGLNGTINLQSGPTNYSGMIHSTPVNWSQ